MDPDLCLDRLMAAVRKGDLEAAREHMSDLDEWLSKGGFLPRRWARNEVHLREDDIDEGEDEGVWWSEFNINGVGHHVELIEVVETASPEGWRCVVAVNDPLNRLGGIEGIRDGEPGTIEIGQRRFVAHVYPFV